MSSAAGHGAVAASLDMLVDRSIGIINDLEPIAVEPGAPRFHHYEARLCDPRALGGQRCQPTTSAAAVDRPSALSAAANAAVAHYAAALYDRHALPLSSFAAADFPCARPAEFALFNQEQYARPGFPYVPAEDETPLRWASTIDLATGETTYVPAAFVFHPYVYDRRSGDKPIAPAAAAGLACGNDVAEAALQGLADVVCRDAMAIFWQAMTVPPQIVRETLTNRLREMIERFEAGGDRVVVLDVTSDNAVPAFAAVLQSRDLQYPAAVCDAGADLDPEVAVVKALRRLAEARRVCQGARKTLEPPTPANDWEDMVDPLDHLVVAADHSRRESFGFAVSSDISRDFGECEPRSTGSVDGDLEAMVRLVATSGHRPYAANLTSADVATFGIAVCRVVVPGYQPLYASHRSRALGGARLYEVPQRLGYRGIGRGDSDNPAPHPFAL